MKKNLTKPFTPFSHIDFIENELFITPENALQNFNLICPRCKTTVLKRFRSDTNVHYYKHEKIPVINPEKGYYCNYYNFELNLKKVY